MGVLTYKGATARESLGSEVLAAVPVWAKRQGFENNPQAVAGAKVFAQASCVGCHTYLGTGSSNLGAPDLSDIGASGRDAAYFQRYVANPREFGNTVMPQFAKLGDKYLRPLAIFLEASKGPK
jgi:mono/diheme cytochrome c family protein